jgi:SAM-dependent methyltransferase
MRPVTEPPDPRADPGPAGAGLMARYASEAGAKAYARKYERSWMRRRSARREAALVREALSRAGARGEVLDVPCGAGRMVATLVDRGDRVVGADLSPEMLGLAARLHAGAVADGRASFVRANATSLPFPGGRFDAVVCWRLLHHVTDRAARVAILAEAARVSRGPVVISYGDATTLKARLHRLRGRRRRCVLETPAELGAEAGEAGLRVAWTGRLSSPFSLLAGALLLPRSGAGGVKP